MALLVRVGASLHVAHGVLQLIAGPCRASSLEQRRVFGKIGLLFCSGFTSMLLCRRTPLVYCWAAIGVAFIILINIAAASEEDEKLARAAKDFIAGNSIRDAYVRGAKDGCVDRIQLNKPAGMSSTAADRRLLRLLCQQPRQINYSGRLHLSGEEQKNCLLIFRKKRLKQGLQRVVGYGKQDISS